MLLTSPLHGINILVTRPSAQAQNLCNKIRVLGGNPLLLPTIEIIAAPAQPATHAAIAKLAAYDLAIFISPNAVQHAAAYFQQHCPVWPAATKVAAIGASTAQALNTLGINVDFCPAPHFTSEGLLAIPFLQTIAGKKILLFRGNDGRDLLANTLRARGAQLTEVIVYQRTLPSFAKSTLTALWQTDTLELIICTSNTGLQNLFTLVGEEGRTWLQNMRLLLVSARMAKFAQTLGVTRTPLVAANATDDALINVLINWQDKQHGTISNTDQHSHN